MALPSRFKIFVWGGTTHLCASFFWYPTRGRSYGVMNQGFNFNFFGCGGRHYAPVCFVFLVSDRRAELWLYDLA